MNDYINKLQNIEKKLVDLKTNDTQNNNLKIFDEVISDILLILNFSLLDFCFLEHDFIKAIESIQVLSGSPGVSHDESFRFSLDEYEDCTTPFEEDFLLPYFSYFKYINHILKLILFTKNQYNKKIQLEPIQRDLLYKRVALPTTVFKEDIHVLHDLYEINYRLTISELDYNDEISNKLYSELQLYYSKLMDVHATGLVLPRFVEILKYKVSCIACKIGYILKKDLYYYHEFSPTESFLNFIEKFNDDGKKLLFPKYLKYFIGSSAEYNYSIEAEALHHINTKYEEKKEIDLICFYIATRFYYQKGKSDDLHLLVVKFKKLYYKAIVEEKSYYVKLAWKKTYNYLVNNLFSLRIKENIEILPELLENIRNVQKETSINNYHPYKKACERLLKFIEKDILDNQELLLSEKICNDIGEKLDLLNQYLIELKEKSYWCKKHHFTPIRLSWDFFDSLSIDGWGNVKFRLFNSVSMPINYTKVEKEIERIETKADILETHFSLYRHIHKETQEVENVKKELSFNTKKEIEILSIFSAIVMFVAGEIQIIKNVTNIKLLFSITFSFSFALSFFVYLIWLITHKDEEVTPIRKRTLYIYLVVFALIFIDLFIFNSNYLYTCTKAFFDSLFNFLSNL